MKISQDSMKYAFFQVFNEYFDNTGSAKKTVYDCIWQNKPRNACENSTEQQNILSVYLPLSMSFSTILQKYPIKSRLLFSFSHFRTYAEIIYRQEISIEI